MPAEAADGKGEPDEPGCRLIGGGPVANILRMKWLSAASTGGSEWAVDIWLWGGVLMAVAGVALVLILLARRRLFSSWDRSSEAWTLQDLRQLHASGQLTDEEYATLRDRILGTAGGGAGSDDAGSPQEAGGVGK